MADSPPVSFAVPIPKAPSQEKCTSVSRFISWGLMTTNGARCHVPPAMCEAHWQRRGRAVPAFRANLCLRCFSGRPLPVKADADEPGLISGRGPLERKHSQEVDVKERGTNPRERETVRVSVAARVARCSPDTVTRLVEGGPIPAWRISRRRWWTIAGASLARSIDPHASHTRHTPA